MGVARTLPAILLCICIRQYRVNPRLFCDNLTPGSILISNKDVREEAPTAHRVQARHQNTDMLPKRCAHVKLEFLTSAGLNCQLEYIILLFVH
jgi:hypothetical protein